MKAIHKYRFGNERAQHVLSLKQGFKVVHSEYVITDKAVYLWIEEPLSVDIKTEEVCFKLALSGDPVAESFDYVASAVDVFGPEAYHIFMLNKAKDLSLDDSDKFIRAA